MPKSAWVLILNGGESRELLDSLKDLAVRVARSQPGISVDGAVLGGRPGLLPVIRRLQRRGP